MAGKDEAEATFMALVEFGGQIPSVCRSIGRVGRNALGILAQKKRSHEDEVGAGLAEMKGDIKNE